MNKRTPSYTIVDGWTNGYGAPHDVTVRLNGDVINLETRDGTITMLLTEWNDLQRWVANMIVNQLLGRDED